MSVGIESMSDSEEYADILIYYDLDYVVRADGNADRSELSSLYAKPDQGNTED